MNGPSIHATAILAGHRGILIRGPSGAGKSKLAWSLLQDGGLGFARLIGDDRVHLQVAHGRVLARPAPALAGLLEVRGAGLLRVSHEPVAQLEIVVDLAAADSERMPDANTAFAALCGIRHARLPVAPGADARLVLLAYLAEKDGAASKR